MKTGFVGLVGRPNVGKSTLVNQLVGKKVAITSNKPQTTRNVIHGVYNDADSQIVFVDTPGIHKPNHKLGTYLNKQAYYSANDVDVVLFLVDATKKMGGGDEFVMDKLKDLNKPIILVINKIDQITHDEILPIIDTYNKAFPFTEIIPLSALKGKNQDRLIPVIKQYLIDDIVYYEPGQISNKPLEFVLAEMIREKVFHLTEEEVPHSTTCIIEQIERKKDSVLIQATIIVDRDSLKKIIIGAKGQKLKEIGTKARIEMEYFLNTKVYLELYVKTIKKWRDKEQYLSEFGYQEFE